MRLIEAASFMTLAGMSGACAALSGLTSYQECAEDCGDAGTTDGSSMEPIDSGNSVDDGAAPAQESEEQGSGPDGPVSSFDAGHWVEDSAAPPEEVSTLGEDGGQPDAPVRSFDAGDGGPDAASDSGVDAGLDAAVDTGPPPMTGPTCGPTGTTTRCQANQVCCANLGAQTNACAATCAANALLSCTTASDCPESAPICCAQATFTPDSKNDPPPVCLATQLTASCAATCGDSPPASGCTFSGTIRLCSHGGDCQSDTANPLGTGLANQCWNYNGAPESWCTSATVGSLGGGVRQQ